MSATEQDGEVQRAQGAEGQGWKETVSEILISLFCGVVLYKKFYDLCKHHHNNVIMFSAISNLSVF